MSSTGENDGIPKTNSPTLYRLKLLGRYGKPYEPPEGAPKFEAYTDGGGGCILLPWVEFGYDERHQLVLGWNHHFGMEKWVTKKDLKKTFEREAGDYRLKNVYEDTVDLFENIAEEMPFLLDELVKEEIVEKNA